MYAYRGLWLSWVSHLEVQFAYNLVVAVSKPSHGL